MEIKIDLDEVAEKLSKSNNEEQAEFINVFSDNLRYNCKTPLRLEAQICDIASKLDKNGESLIKNLYDFILLKNKS